MDERLALTVAQFELHSRLFQNVLLDLEEVRQERLNDMTNHAAWLAGHLVSTRFMLANLLGAETSEPHPELFGNGKGIDPQATYPALKSCLESWQSITPRFLSRLKALSREQLNAEGPFQVPTGKNLDQIIAFFVHHEAYHIGQLGILRKYFAKEAMSYN